MNFWAVQILNGVTFGMVLFLIAAGLSLIFGLMRIINLAHGCFYLMGAYVALTVIQSTNNFLLALISGMLSITVIGIALHRLCVHRFQDDHQSQVLVTLAFVFIFADLILIIWGGDPYLLPNPPLFDGSITLGNIIFPRYRLVIIGVGMSVAAGLWLFQEKTRLGALVRAGVDDAEMARGLGINVPLLFSSVFGLGAGISAFGGVIAGPFIGVYPGLEWGILLLAMAVLLIGGLGSLKGALVGSLIVGLADNFGKVLIPELALFPIFGSVVLVLAFRPAGLFGRL